MSTFNCQEQMKQYHEEEVTLPKTEQDTMRARRDSGRTRLNGGLDRNGKPKPYLIASQGSYSMRTMVQDAEADYDIDDGVYFYATDLKDGNGSSLSPSAARQMICDALSQDDRLKYPAQVRENCVRQEYPEGYHIDIPLYRTVVPADKEESEETHELSSGHSWIESDARAVTRWFNDIVGDLNAGESDGSQMRRVVKLTKRFARSRSKWKSEVPSGIVLSVLVVDHFVVKAERDDDSTLETWKRMHTALTQSLRVKHPVLGTDLTKDGDPKVAYFRDRLGDALTRLEALERLGCTSKEALSAWDEVFNTDFFSKHPPKDNPSGGTGSRGGPPFVQTSEKVSRRDSGDGRFG